MTHRMTTKEIAHEILKGITHYGDKPYHYVNGNPEGWAVTTEALKSLCDEVLSSPGPLEKKNTSELTLAIEHALEVAYRNGWRDAQDLAKQLEPIADKLIEAASRVRDLP